MKALRRKEMKALKRKLTSFYTVIIAYLMIIPQQAMAFTLTKGISNLTSYLAGDLAKVVGGLAICVCGYLTFETGQMPKKTLFIVVVALGLILGASDLYTRFTA